MIDCHCHLLPDVDDGAPSLDAALQMAADAAEGGTRRIVCTPHHLNGLHLNTAPAIRAAVAVMQERIIEAGIPLLLAPGAELHLVPELPAQVGDGVAMTYNDLGKAVLVELPKGGVPLGAETILGQLIRAGVTPVIAHPERNQELLRNPERLGEWVGWGCMAQLTAQSCSGDFGEPRQRIARQWIESGWVQLVASDAHRPQGRRPGTLTDGRTAIARWCGDAAAELLTEGNPARLLAGQPLQHLPPAQAPQPPRARPGWQRWFRLGTSRG